jgi:hypothetical protein
MRKQAPMAKPRPRDAGGEPVRRHETNAVKPLKFHQSKLVLTDGTKMDSGAETKIFSVLGYSSYLPSELANLSQIILQDNQPDNVCGGKVMFTLMKN